MGKHASVEAAVVRAGELSANGTEVAQAAAVTAAPAQASESSAAGASITTSRVELWNGNKRLQTQVCAGWALHGCVIRTRVIPTCGAAPLQCS
jgi:hypothetical protein